MAKLQVDSTINLKVKVSSLESKIGSYTNKIQEMHLALAIKESLYEQGLKKNLELTTKNTELQRQLEVTMREGRLQEGYVKKLTTTLRVANERRTQAEATVQELLTDPLNTPTSIGEDGGKWKK